MKSVGLFIAIIAISLSGCSSVKVERVLEPQEKALDTGGKTTMLFHSILYYPSEISLKFSGYIIGVEKSPVDRVTHSTDEIVIGTRPGSQISSEDMEKEIVDKKILYVSHIVENSLNEYGVDNCAHYNAYYRAGNAEHKPTINYCEGIEPKEVAPKDAYTSSWEALDRLKKSIDRSISDNRYSHIIVVTMGWNTVQEEAIRNFNSIMKNIKLASKEETFNPLFIGVTWPSQWESAWFEPIISTASFGIKARDADELGLTWLGVVVNDVLRDASNRVPTYLIGHSFGSRAMSVASCMGPVIKRQDGEVIELNRVTGLINLQGAYLMNRIVDKPNGKDYIFPDKCKNVDTVTFTSSKYDTAMDTAFWGTYVGNDKAYDTYCGKHTGMVNCSYTNTEGHIKPVHDYGRHINYINANAIINKNAYLSGGNAHSDIYRGEHGVMIWDIINSSKKVN